MPGLRILDEGPELSSTVTFWVNHLTPDYIVNTLRQQKINVVASYKNYALIDFTRKQVNGAVRVSPHYYNTQIEIDTFLEALKAIIKSNTK